MVNARLCRLLLKGRKNYLKRWFSSLNVIIDSLHFSLPCQDAACHCMQAFVKSVVCGVNVPAFFCISGYLFFRNLDKWDWSVFGQKLRRRISTLLLPYLLWNIVSFALVTGTNYNELPLKRKTQFRIFI